MDSTNQSGGAPTESHPPQLALVAAPAAQSLALAAIPESTASHVGASSSATEPARQPRPPAAPTLQEALRWSVEARGDDTGPRTLAPMSAEDRQFLLDAMAHLQGDTDGLAKAIAALSDPHTPVDRLQALLDGLEEVAEDTDGAMGLANTGGLDALVGLAAHANPGVQARALRLLAAASQNNPPVQHRLETLDALTAILPALHERAAEEVRLAALSAVSCLVRGHDGLARRLLAAPATPALLRAAVAGPPRLTARALYLVRCLLPQSRDFAALLFVPDLFDTLFTVLVPDAADEIWEQALASLALCPRTLVSAAHSTKLAEATRARRGALAVRTDAPSTHAALLTTVEAILLAPRPAASV
eukprot:m.9517 g.9517  ORF g.9517 m.9517 type:complete len:360 (+) comp5430_c0_seq2:213-1292(+)